MLKTFLTLIRSRSGRRTLRYVMAKKYFNPLARRAGYTIIADYHLQPIPNNSEILHYANKERPLNSIALNADRQTQFATCLLRKYGDEFNDGSTLSYCGYMESTSGLVSGDAEFLYSMVRDRKPRRIVEVGAGGSTQIMAAALRGNFLETHTKTTFCSIDPYPRSFLRTLKSKVEPFMEFTLLQKQVQEVDLSLFESLEENDILFVDSSHVFKQGSDVEFEFLSIYPVLRAGVVVHIHDIFFPFDYPQEWNTKEYWFWNEQYFLETFLQFNSKFEVLASLSLVLHHSSQVFTENIDAYHGNRGQSFWMRAIS